MASNLSHGMKRVLSGIMALLIVVGSASISANGKKGGLFANYSITASAMGDLNVAQSGASSDNSISYNVNGANFDVKGQNGLQVTFSNAGFQTYFSASTSSLDNAATKKTQVASGATLQLGKVYTIDNVELRIVAAIINGNTVQVTYDVYNPTSSTQYVKVGSCADTQLGSNDSIPVYVTNSGLRMQDSTNVLFISMSDRSASGRWVGSYSDRASNIWTSNNVSASYSGDSGVAWHWDYTLAPGESHQFGAFIAAGQYLVVDYDVNGGNALAPAMLASGASFTPATPTRAGYTFKGWYTTSNFSGNAYTGGTVSSDLTLYAKWEAIPATAPTITTQPSGLNLTYNHTSGDTLSVAATAATSHSLSYQWYSNTTNSNSGGTAISGATSATYRIPQTQNVGTYYYYCVVKATRTDNGLSATTTSNAATVKINKANPTATAPTLKNSDLVYNNTAKQLITAGGSVTGNGTMRYGISSSNSTQPESWYTSITDNALKRTDVGTYYIWYKADASTNYNAAAAQCAGSVAITRASINPTVTLSGWTFGGNPNTPSVSGNSGGGTPSYQYKVKNAADSTYSASVPTAAGDYTVKATIPQTANYNGASCTADFTISKAASSANPIPAATNPTYNGSYQALVSAGTANGGTMYYRLGSNGAWGTSIPTAKDAGDYIVFYKVEGDSNHNNNSGGSVNVTIAQKEATLSWDNTSFTYDGSTHLPTASVSNLESGDSCTVTITGNQTNAGSYDATATALSNSNYKLPTDVTQSFTINPKAVSITWGTDSFTYDGSAKTITAETEDLVGNDSLTVSGNINTNAGTYTASVVLPNDNYVFADAEASSKEFTINPKNISTATITPASISDQNWTGSAISGLVTVSDVVDETSIITANDYEITYSNNTNAGLSSAEAAPTVTINGKGNYTGTVTKNFNILAQLDLSDENVRAALQSITYNGATISFDTDNAPANAYYYLLGQDITLITTARLEFPDGFEVDEDWDDDVSYSYTFTIPDGTSTVKPERVYDYSFRTDNDKLYGDDAYNFADEEKLVATLNANSSEYLGDNNVSVTKSNEYEPDVTSVIKYQVKGANGRYSDMSNTPVNVGSYYVKSEVRTMNISFWLQKAFEITARPYADHTNEISVSLASSEFAFNGTAHQPVIIVKDTNEKLTEANQTLVEGRDYELGYLDADGNFVKFGSDGATDTLEKTNAGTYTVAVNFIGNYSGTTTIDWTIVTAVLPTLTISDASADYNGQAHEVEVAGVDNINDLITITYKQGETTLDGAPVNAGTYTAVITIKDTDYVFADGQITEQEFTISPKAITVTPSAVSKIFGNADPQFSCTTEDELANSEEQNFSEYIGRAAGEDTGTYGYNITNAIEGSLVVGNYQISIDPENTNVFTIDPLVITEPTITVNDPDAMIYNTLAQTPAITVKVGDIVIDESEYNVAYSENVNAGENTAIITITDKDGGNYTISGTANFTILPKVVDNPTITFTDTATATFTGSPLTPEFTVYDGETLISANEYDFTYSNNTNAGTGTVTLTDNAGGNYVISGSNTFGIAPMEVTEGLTIEIPNEDIIYDGTAKQPNVTVKVGDTVIDPSEYTVTYSNNTNAGEDTAGITITDNENGNYTINGSRYFTIIPKTVTEPTIVIPDDTIIYDGTAKEPAVTVFDGETQVNPNEYSVSYSNNINASEQAVIAITDNENGNYIISGSGTFTIVPKSIAGVTIADVTDTYVADGETSFEPVPVVNDGDITDNPLLIKDTDYTVSYSNNVHAGKGKIIITGKGNYSDTTFAEKEFDICSTIDLSAVSGQITSIKYQGSAVEANDTGKYSFLVDTNIEINSSVTLAFPENTVTLVSKKGTKNGYTYTVKILSAVDLVTVTHDSNYRITKVDNENELYGKDNNDKQAPEEKLAELTAIAPIYYLDIISDDIDENTDVNNVHLQTVENVNFTLTPDAYEYTAISDNALLKNELPYNAGTYNVRARVPYGGNNYYLNTNITVLSRNYNDNETEFTISASDLTFNGTAQTPVITITDNKLGETDNVLVEGTDYELGYMDGDTFVAFGSNGAAYTLAQTNADTYNIAVQFKGNYSGTAAVSWTMNRLNFEDNLTYTVTMEGKTTPELTNVKYGETALTKNTDYTVSDVESGNIVIIGAGNYIGTKTVVTHTAAVASTYTVPGNVEYWTYDNVNYVKDDEGKFVAAETVVVPVKNDATSAITGNELTDTANIIKFSYENTYAGTEAAEYRFLCYRGEEPIEELTFGMANVTDVKKDNATGTINVKDLGNGIYLRPYIKIGNENVYGNQVYVRYSDLMNQKAFAEATSAITGNELTDTANIIKFSYENTYAGTEAAEYRFLCYRGEEPIEELTFGMANVTDVKKDNATGTINVKDLGNGIYLRPYIKIGNENVYGNQVYVRYSDLMNQKAFAEATSAITGNELTDTANIIKFSYENTYAGTEAAEYRFLCYRGEEPIEELTFGMANVTDVKKDNATGTINVKDLGNGIYLRPYIKIGNENVYGNQVYVRYSDLMNQKAFAEATSAITGNELTDTANIIKFSYENTYAGTEAAEYRFLCYRGEEPIEELTFGMANVTDVKKDNATGTINVKDLGNGIYLRPYIKIGNENVYGNQVYVRYSDLMNQKAFAEATSAITGNELTDTANIIKFSYENTYAGTEAAEYRFLCYRGEEPIEELTFGMANVTDVKKDNATGTINVKDLGSGIYLRPYIKIGDQYKYGEQAFVKYSDLQE